MKTRFSFWGAVGVMSWAVNCSSQHVRPATGTPAGCSRAILEGNVKAGESFEGMFRPGLEFKLEAIASGWIVRVYPAGRARELHDYAELATPPYESVTPLAISTDFSFRAQDAVGWNPRRFRYAESPAVFARMQRDYAPAMNGDVTAAADLAALAANQPEAELTILDARLVPGTSDQVPMAAAVASHFATTPHEVEQGSGAMALGRLTSLRFRVAFDVPQAERTLPGVKLELRNCSPHPTMRAGHAS